MARQQSPKLRMYFPVWWHHHGNKMRLKQFDEKNRTIVISGSAAKVIIQKASSLIEDVEGWLVDWEVVQCRPYEEGARGRSRFSDEDLAAAFGLSEESGKFGDWLIEEFGADVANQKRYIRWKKFLNIPCPGTGHDGDPNVSIYIDDEIQKAVRQLLRL